MTALDVGAGVLELVRYVASSSGVAAAVALPSAEAGCLGAGMTAAGACPDSMSGEGSVAPFQADSKTRSSSGSK